MTTATSRSRASEILAAVGVEEDFSFYGPFTAEDQKAVLTVPLRIMGAWAANDADVFANIFVENGSLLMRDDQLTGREEIRAYMRAEFDGAYRGARVDGWPLELRFLADGIAMIVTQGGILLAGETQIAPERRIRAMWVVVDRDGEWKLFSHQSSPLHG